MTVSMVMRSRIKCGMTVEVEMRFHITDRTILEMHIRCRHPLFTFILHSNLLQILFIKLRTQLQPQAVNLHNRSVTIDLNNSAFIIH